MTKFALDTNALIEVCKSDDLLETLIKQFFRRNKSSKLFIQKRSMEEFNKKASPAAKANLNELKQLSEVDEEQYFTIGASKIGGPDKIPGPVYAKLVPDYSEEEFSKSGTNKGKSEWIRSKQGDGSITSFAKSKKCKYVVTDDQPLTEKIEKGGLGITPLGVNVFLSRYIFASFSEYAFSDYLITNKLRYDYERKWGDRRPDFTVYADKTKRTILAIFDVKDIEHTKQEKAALKRGEIVGRSFNPYTPTRNKIISAKRQFSACKSYPCILIIGSDGPPLPDPLIVLAAMYGDLTISFSIDGSNSSEYLGKNGSMINPSNRKGENTTITAIGVLKYVRPDNIKSGFNEKLSKLHENMDINNKSQLKDYFKKAKDLEKSLRKKGYNLGLTETAVDYILNPLARRNFPRKYLKKGYSTLRDYDIEEGTFSITSDWKKPKN